MRTSVYVCCPECGELISLMESLQNYLDRTGDPNGFSARGLLVMPAPVVCNLWCRGCGQNTLTLVLELGCLPETEPAVEGGPVDGEPLALA